MLQCVQWMSSQHFPYIPLNLQIRLLCLSCSVYIVSCLLWIHGIYFPNSPGHVRLPRGNRMEHPWWVWTKHNKEEPLCLLWDIVHVARIQSIVTLIHLDREIHICFSDLQPNRVTLWILKVKQNLYTKWFRIYGVTWQPSTPVQV